MEQQPAPRSNARRPHTLPARLAALLLVAAVAAALAHGAAAKAPPPPSAAKKPATRICINMIVKNEMKDLPAFLASARPHISGMLMCDTGSTDGTQDAARKFLKDAGLAGKVLEHKWTNFGVNRDECLLAAQEWVERDGGPCDYFWLAEPDMTLVAEDGVEPGSVSMQDTKLTAPAYWIVQRSSNGYTFDALQMIRATREFRWAREPVHEYVNYVGNGSTGGVYEVLKTPALAFVIHDGGGADGATSRFERDEQLLMEEVRINPNNSRAWFYLGNTRFDLGHYADAAEAYTRRLEMGGWDEELFMAAFKYAQCVSFVWDAAVRDDANAGSGGKDGKVSRGAPKGWPAAGAPLPLGWGAAVARNQPAKAAALDAFVAASALLPYRPEPYFKIASILRDDVLDYPRCYQWAASGLAQPWRERGLFVDTSARAFGLFDCVCTCAYYVGRYEEGLKACDAAAAAADAEVETAKKLGLPPPSYPQSVAERVRGNRKWYLDKLPAAAAADKGKDGKKGHTEL